MSRMETVDFWPTCRPAWSALCTLHSATWATTKHCGVNWKTSRNIKEKHGNNGCPRPLSCCTPMHCSCYTAALWHWMLVQCWSLWKSSLFLRAYILSYECTNIWMSASNIRYVDVTFLYFYTNFNFNLLSLFNTVGFTLFSAFKQLFLASITDSEGKRDKVL